MTLNLYGIDITNIFRKYFNLQFALLEVMKFANHENVDSKKYICLGRSKEHITSDVT